LENTDDQYIVIGCKLHLYIENFSFRYEQYEGTLQEKFKFLTPPPSKAKCQYAITDNEANNEKVTRQEIKITKFQIRSVRKLPKLAERTHIGLKIKLDGE
jgi:hypothetical protein